MLTQIIVAIVLGLLSLNAVNYLLSYFRLSNSGTCTTGIILSFSNSKSIMTKNSLIPKIEFRIENKQTVIGTPTHSWFVELNKYQVDKKYIVYYDKKDPSIFIVGSIRELVTNITLVTCALVSILWLILV